MKKLFKKITSLVILTVLSISLTVPAFASETTTSTEILTLEECEAALNEEGKKYGMRFNLTGTVDPNMEITQAVLDEALAIVRADGEKYLSKKTLLGQQRIENTNLKNDITSPFSMPITKSVEGTFRHDITLIASTFFAVTADVTIDAQNNYVISVANTDIRATAHSGLIERPEPYDVHITYSKNYPQTGFVHFVAEGKYYAAGAIGALQGGQEVSFIGEVTVDCR